VIRQHSAASGKEPGQSGYDALEITHFPSAHIQAVTLRTAHFFCSYFCSSWSQMQIVRPRHLALCKCACMCRCMVLYCSVDTSKPVLDDKAR